MKLIKRSFNPISLSNLIELHEQGITPKHAVAVTFDDGYSDFAEYAFPILQEEGIPATLFITTGFVNGDVWLWPDKIKFLLSKKSQIKIPSKLDDDIRLEESSISLWKDISNYCLTLDNLVKEAYISDLFSLNDVCLPEYAPEGFEAVGWEQLNRFIEGGSVDIGSHTCTHPVLTRLSLSELRYELMFSKKSIYCNLGVDVSILCYPNGTKFDFNDKVKRELLNSGYKYGVAAYPTLDPLDDVLSVGRYSVDKDLERFTKTIFGISYVAAMFRRSMSSDEY
ncbi:polysaccharide deacetylase family protein [Marinobacter litoralis]|uniref:polysaccharide deacetylase family protein n=1 Tax=Marinobacter litoralis TaxID=187981 RepID=UPI0018EE1B5B|nr:polysaccharide deacetylase family protein [Marinobacter litoralis]MBJ6137690.1 polysaccharide deacetylase family protein [Marinobacter litoralis]